MIDNIYKVKDYIKQKDRYYIKQNDLITLSDGNIIAVSSNWGKGKTFDCVLEVFRRLGLKIKEVVFDEKE